MLPCTRWQFLSEVLLFFPSTTKQSLGSWSQQRIVKRIRPFSGSICPHELVKKSVTVLVSVILDGSDQP